MLPLPSKKRVLVISLRSQIRGCGQGPHSSGACSPLWAPCPLWGRCRAWLGGTHTSKEWEIRGEREGFWQILWHSPSGCKDETAQARLSAESGLQPSSLPILDPSLSSDVFLQSNMQHSCGPWSECCTILRRFLGEEKVILFNTQMKSEHWATPTCRKMTLPYTATYVSEEILCF